MINYIHFELEIKNKNLPDLKTLSDKEQSYFGKDIRPAIYIYRNSKTNQMYVGQTTHFYKRHKEHFNPKQYKSKFNLANFDSVIVIFSQHFNGTSLDDLESQLISFLTADHPASTNNKYIAYDQALLNSTKGNAVPNYKDQEFITFDVLLPFWEKVLYKEKHWVNNASIDDVRNSALVKYSPIKFLSSQQTEIIDNIIDDSDNSFVINGDAGTGKTVLLTHLVSKLLDSRPDARIGVVVQTNWLKTATSIFNAYNINHNNLSINTSTKLINDSKTYDIIIIDEAHKLSRKFAKQQPTFNSVYKNFKDSSNHLQALQKKSKQLVLMYDVLQGIRPANITRVQFKTDTEGYIHYKLKPQFRIQTPNNKSYTAEDYLNGIKYLLYKDTGLLTDTNFNPNFKRSVFKDHSNDAYFGYFEDNPLHYLKHWIEDDRNLNNAHINRLLAGLVEPWQQKDGKDPSKTHWAESKNDDLLELRWNSTQENWINSKDKDAESQVGSVFAVQGIDLNKVGVLIGPDLQVDTSGHLYGDLKHFHNTNGTFPKNDNTPTNAQEFTLFVLNIYYVLLTRGINGIRIGFWKNDQFKQYMKNVFEL